MPKRIWGLIASVLAVALAVAFLGNLAIHIAELPLMIIIFGVLAMMLWDYIDTMRTNARAGDVVSETAGDHTLRSASGGPTATHPEDRPTGRGT